MVSLSSEASSASETWAAVFLTFLLACFHIHLSPRKVDSSH